MDASSTSPGRAPWLRTPLGLVIVVYTALGVGLWGVPLLNVLHAESSALVAGVAFFASGLSALVFFRRDKPVRTVLGGHLAALLVPWLLLTLTLIRVPNCGYGQGLLFYLLFAPPSVVLAVALAYALRARGIRFQRILLVGIGLGIVVVTPLYDLGLHPQFYTYNHVFGGVLGPIYDEELVIRPGLVVFRGMTLLWALLAFGIGRRIRLRRAGRNLPTRPWKAGSIGGLVAVVLLLGTGYLLAVPLGFNAAGWYIQRTLGGGYRTEHFDIYYDPEVLEADQVRRIAEDHEYRYARLAEQLEVDVPERIASYLYPDPETKARMTGARTTNVAPVWLHRPQVHVLQAAYSRVFPHELAHVFSRGFGLPVMRATLSVGLVEGLAVALEPPDGLPTPHEQVAVAAAQQMAGGQEASYVLADRLATQLSPLGFWTGRGAVSYTTMGSFVRYLLDAYGPDAFKDVYAWADFDAVYGKSLPVLAREWERYIMAQPVIDRTAGAFTTARFSIPSLFEKRCPHYVPRYRRRYREGLAAWAAEDTVLTLRKMEAALRRQPLYEPALAAWARLKLLDGAASDVVARLDTVEADRLTPVLALPLGDALTVLGRPAQAWMRYAQAFKHLPGFAREQGAILLMRQSLVDQPSVMRLLTSGAAPLARLRRLAEHRHLPAARGFEAILLAQEGQFEEAVERMSATPVLVEETSTPFHSNILQWQRLAWLAQWSYQAGTPTAAGAYARGLAETYHAAGAFNAAAAWRDFAAKMAWVAAYREASSQQ